jgi:REP element-mobilizing transposase RayT
VARATRPRNCFVNSRDLERKYDYRRRLPHLQPDYRALFVTFCAHARWQMPEFARSIVLDCCLTENQRMYLLEVAVVMPDHVHMIFSPLRNRNGNNFSLPQIVQKLKSVSAHTINKRLPHKGPVWQEEFFDHVIRQADSLQEKIDYVLLNPVRKGLVTRPEDYRWIWRNFAGEVARATQA